MRNTTVWKFFEEKKLKHLFNKALYRGRSVISSHGEIAKKLENFELVHFLDDQERQEKQKKKTELYVLAESNEQQK